MVAFTQTEPRVFSAQIGGISRELAQKWAYSGAADLPARELMMSIVFSVCPWDVMVVEMTPRLLGYGAPANIRELLSPLRVDHWFKQNPGRLPRGHNALRRLPAEAAISLALRESPEARTLIAMEPVNGYGMERVFAFPSAGCRLGTEPAYGNVGPHQPIYYELYNRPD